MGVDPMVSQREIRTGGYGYMLIKPPVPYDNCVLNVKAVVAAFNQEKALVEAFLVITNLQMDLRLNLYFTCIITSFLFSPKSSHSFSPCEPIMEAAAGRLRRL